MPELVLEWNGQSWTLDPGQTYVLGRGGDASFVFDDARVSWRHGTVSFQGQGWVFDDHGSTNGTYVAGQRVQQVSLAPGTVVNLGNPQDGPRLAFSAPWAASSPPQYQSRHEVNTVLASDSSPQVAQVPPGQAPYGGPVQQQPGVPQQPSQTGPQGPGGTAPQDQGQRSGGAGGSPTAIRNLAGSHAVKIGRALENDVVTDDLLSSRFHAELHPMPDGRFELVDVSSHNGTYVNGQPVQGRQVIGPQDVVGIGHTTFRLVGETLQEFQDTGEVSFSAHDLSVIVGKDDERMKILDSVSFGLNSKSLVAVLGPSGSGKSTLVKALTGYRPADEGGVLYDGRDLYRQYAELRSRIGLVPQDDILHSQLTVRTALRYAARLRFPGDTKAAERNARVDEVIGELGLDHRADNKITALSGGQRKRVSVALELLTKPSLLFLDEPTSGLDPGMERQVMQNLRGLADDGRTCVVITHNTESLDLCDRVLVLAVGGKVAYFGPSDQALAFFQVRRWSEIFDMLDRNRDFDWAGRYRNSEYHRMYSGEMEAAQQAQQQQQMLQSGAVPQMPSRQQKPTGWVAQVSTLCRRYVRVIAADKGFLGLSIALPVVLGVVSVIIPSDFGLDFPPGHKPYANQDAAIILMILTIGMCFAGAANSVRELVKERVIYERERATGLSRSAYMMSKVIVLGVITALQGVVIAAIGFSARELPDEGLVLSGSPFVEMTIALIVLGITSMMIGLVISSVVKSSEMTMPLLVIFAIVQVVFTGAIFQIFGTLGVTQLAWLNPSRWGVAAMGTSIDLSHLMLPWNGNTHDPELDQLWEHTAQQWSIDVGVLVLMAVLCGVLVTRLLRKHEPEIMRK